VVLNELGGIQWQDNVSRWVVYCAGRHGTRTERRHCEF